MRTRIGSVDLNTGEILEGVPVWVGRKSAFTQMYGKGRFLIMAQDAMLIMATDRELTKQEPTRVFYYLCARLDYENFIRVPQTEICEALEMKKSHVSRAVNLLESKGIIIKGPKVGQSYAYRLNPNFGYKGDPRGKVIRGRFGSYEHSSGLEVINGGKTEQAQTQKSQGREPSQKDLEDMGQERLF